MGLKLFAGFVFVGLVTGCSLVSPTCRQATGPVQLHIQGDMGGGSVMAEVGEGGEFISYPMPMDGQCFPPKGVVHHE